MSVFFVDNKAYSSLTVIWLGIVEKMDNLHDCQGLVRTMCVHVNAKYLIYSGPLCLLEVANKSI